MTHPFGFMAFFHAHTPVRARSKTPFTSVSFEFGNRFGQCARLVALLFVFHCSVSAQFPDSAKFSSYSEFKTALLSAAERPASLDSLWTLLVSSRRVPYAHGDSVAFLYRSSASAIRWNGDFNNWGSQSGGNGSRVGSTTLWMWETTFPVDARLDYKIVVGSSWILDPNNPLTQMSGFGPNSELRMPLYRPSPFVTRNAQTPRGTLTANQLIQSQRLGYSVHYRVYTPSGYQSLSNLPVLYVTDGHEYLNDQMGSMVISLDNLIHDGLIRPVIVVFISPVNPQNSNQNRRAEEYRMNESFLRFVREELVPLIDTNYRTARMATERGILGTSLGGICAAFFGIRASDTFGLIGIQSPAFWNMPQILTEYRDSTRLPLKLYMSSGTINDTQDRAREMQTILNSKSYPLFYREVNEGHSWGNWRALLPELLIYFFAPSPLKVSARAAESTLPKSFNLKNYPNPFNPSTMITYLLPERADITLDIFDALGRKITTLFRGTQGAGVQSMMFDSQPYNLSSGIYLYRLRAEYGGKTLESSNAMLYVK